jgi:site-specific DNA recombinase
MMLQMLGVFAEFERATIVERIVAGMERAASQGRWVVGKVPYGYERIKETKLIHPHPVQAMVIRRIFDLYVKEQMGAESIAKLLNSEGHRTKNGMPFARPIVIAILQNPVYVGKIEFRGIISPGLHESLVGSETFEAAVRILQERGESQAMKRGHPSDYLLSGLVRCGQCDRAFVGTRAHGRSRAYHYYTCSTRYRYGTQFCDAERIAKESLEEAVFEQLYEVFTDSALIAEAFEEASLTDEQNAEEIEARLSALRQDQAAVKRAIDRYFSAFEQGSLNPAECKERIDRLKTRLDALTAEEASLSEKARRDDEGPTVAEDVAEWAKDLPYLLSNGTAQQRKALLRKLIKELRVMSKSEIRPTYKIPALVRAPLGQVERSGFEPPTSSVRVRFHASEPDRKNRR